MTLFFFGAWNPCTTTQPQFWSSSPPPNGNLTAVQPENILQNYPSEFPSFLGGFRLLVFLGGLVKMCHWPMMCWQKNSLQKQMFIRW